MRFLLTLWKWTYDLGLVGHPFQQCVLSNKSVYVFGTVIVVVFIPILLSTLWSNYFCHNQRHAHKKTSKILLIWNLTWPTSLIWSFVTSNISNVCDIETLIWCAQLRPLGRGVRSDAQLRSTDTWFQKCSQSGKNGSKHPMLSISMACNVISCKKIGRNTQKI